MKYTKDDLAKMSELELSMALINSLGYNPQPLRSYNLGEYPSIVCKKDSNYFSFILDQWDCLMPLAVEYGITLKSVACPAGSGYAHYAESYCGVYHTDYVEPPQRAIACCLILVLQERE